MKAIWKDIARNPIKAGGTVAKDIGTGLLLGNVPIMRYTSSSWPKPIRHRL